MPFERRLLIENCTNGANYGISTSQIITKLDKWDKQYGIEVEDVSSDALVVTFRDLPIDTISLAKEICEFCPDTVSQGFGCYEELLSEAAEAGLDIDPEVMALAEGVDFDNPNYGEQILAKALERRKKVHLWWD